MDAKFKHLEFIQSTISRMASNSFQVKAWTITITSAILALGASSDVTTQKHFMIIVALPIIMFWLLDGYFLWQERLFRGLYMDISKKNENEIDFGMDTRLYIEGRNTWFKSMFSKTLNIFYGFLVLALLIIIFYMH